jgi:carbon-monoxide dehydrogenase medium subunit
MRRFQLEEPRSMQEALQILVDREDSKPIAGGTALLILIKQGLYVPKTLVNLKKIKNASDITYDAERGLRVGALTTIHDLETSPVVCEHYPTLANACHVVANIRIRNMATIGGNLAHADYQSDPPAVLVALDSKVELSSSKGIRQASLEEFLVGSYETKLEPTELLTALLVPPSPQGVRGTYIKFTTRSSEDRPCAGIAALALMKNGICESIRLVVGAVSQTPIRIRKAEELARAEKLNDQLIEKIALEAARAVEPIEDLHGPADYKRRIVEVLTGRALGALVTEGVRV